MSLQQNLLAAAWCLGGNLLGTFMIGSFAYVLLENSLVLSISMFILTAIFFSVMLSYAISIAFGLVESKLWHSVAAKTGGTSFR